MACKRKILYLYCMKGKFKVFRTNPLTRVKSKLIIKNVFCLKIRGKTYYFCLLIITYEKGGTNISTLSLERLFLC